MPEIGIFEISPIQIGRLETGMFQTCPFHMNALQMRVFQMRPAQVRALQMNGGFFSRLVFVLSWRHRHETTNESSQWQARKVSTRKICSPQIQTCSALNITGKYWPSSLLMGRQ